MKKLKLKEKFETLNYRVVIAKSRGLKGLLCKKHNGDLKEEMLKLGIMFVVFGIVSVCIYAIVNSGSAWATGQADKVFK